VPLAEKQPGFLQHGIAQIGERSAVSVTFYVSEEDAGAPVGESAAWVRENLTPWFARRGSLQGVNESCARWGRREP